MFGRNDQQAARVRESRIVRHEGLGDSASTPGAAVFDREPWLVQYGRANGTVGGDGEAFSTSSRASSRAAAPGREACLQLCHQASNGTARPQGLGFGSMLRPRTA